MLFKVHDRKELVDIVSRITPHQVAERMDPKWRLDSPEPTGFEQMLHRASVAAVRLCGDPPLLAKGTQRGQIEWQAKSYLRNLVQRRDEFVTRAAKRSRVA